MTLRVKDWKGIKNAPLLPIRHLNQFTDLYTIFVWYFEHIKVKLFFFIYSMKNIRL